MKRTRTIDPAPAGRALPSSPGGWQQLLPIEEETGASGRGCASEGQAHRCSCGNLLARLVASGVELKCRRCKRIVVLPLQPRAER